MADIERLAIGPGENMVSEVAYTGTVDVLIDYNVYAAGDVVTVQYRHGATYGACEAAAWHTYLASFTSLGYVQIRIVPQDLLLKEDADGLLLENSGFVLEDTTPDTDIERVVISWATDSHYTDPEDPYYDPNCVDGATNLVAWVAAANAASADMAVITGDIALLSTDMIEDAGAVLDGLNNKFAVIGNQDVGPNGFTPEQFAAQKALCVSEYGMSSTYYSQDVGFLHVIVLDACFDGEDDSNPDSDGHVPSAEMTWLGNDIAATSKEAVLVLMHHWMHGCMDNEAAVIAELEAMDNVFVLSGHYHVAGTWSYKLNGTKTHEWNLSPLFHGHYSVVTISHYIESDSYDVHLSWRAL